MNRECQIIKKKLSPKLYDKYRIVKEYLSDNNYNYYSELSGYKMLYSNIIYDITIFIMKGDYSQHKIILNMGHQNSHNSSPIKYYIKIETDINKITPIEYFNFDKIITEIDHFIHGPLIKKHI